MASAMRKMAVYLGLVEDDNHYQDKYDSYGEYEEYEEPADRLDRSKARAGTAGTTTRLPHGLAPRAGPRRQISPVLRHCIHALTMKRVLLGSTSAKARQ